MKINIDATTLNRPVEYTESIIQAIEQGKPFIIYYSEEDYLLTVPQYKIVICFAGGRVSTKELIQDMGKYIARIQLGMIVYDKFSTVDDWYRSFPAIENVYLLSK